MTLVEDIAGRHRCIVEVAESRLRHDQGMVGHDDARVTRLADVLLYKAAAEMWADRVNTLATPIGEPADPPSADQLGKPTWKIAGNQITSVGCGDPARDQPQMADCPTRAVHRGGDCILIVQQTQKILPAFAND